MNGAKLNLVKVQLNYISTSRLPHDGWDSQSLMHFNSELINKNILSPSHSTLPRPSPMEPDTVPYKMGLPCSRDPPPWFITKEPAVWIHPNTVHARTHHTHPTNGVVATLG